MRTRLTDVLEVEHPVMLAGMGGVSYHRLAAAVSEAGGFGCLGASTMGHELMIDEIAQTRALTTKPFGVDLLTAVAGQVETQVQSVIDGGARVFVAGLGVPRDVIDLCHANNVLVASMCGKVRHATAAVEAGCDIVVAQGTEAGGHTGQVATMALVPQVVDAVGDRVPVVAAGGLFDGRGLAAVTRARRGRRLGRHTVHRDTRRPARVPGYKDVLIGLAEDGTVVSRSYTGKTCRVVRNEWTQHFEEHPAGARAVPTAVLASTQAGVSHLGGDEHTTVDPDREFFPSARVSVRSTSSVPPPSSSTIRREAEAALGHVGRRCADRARTRTHSS